MLIRKRGVSGRIFRRSFPETPRFCGSAQNPRISNYFEKTAAPSASLYILFQFDLNLE